MWQASQASNKHPKKRRQKVSSVKITLAASQRRSQRSFDSLDADLLAFGGSIFHPPSPQGCHCQLEDDYISPRYFYMYAQNHNCFHEVRRTIFTSGLEEPLSQRNRPPSWIVAKRSHQSSSVPTFQNPSRMFLAWAPFRDSSPEMIVGCLITG
jgi:hypothetical protein